MIKSKFKSKFRTSIFRDLQGASALVIDAITGTTSVVEDLHQNITGLSPIIGKRQSKPTRGITGLVYRSVRGITRGVGHTVNFSLAQLDHYFGSAAKRNPEHDAVRAAINGVIGDKLAASGNALAIEPRLIPGANTQSFQAKSHVIVMVHGLCMNDHQWTRNAHNHGEQLAPLLDAQTAYFIYNSGQSIKQNGEALAQALERLIVSDRLSITQITLLGHSMGGLVSRRACQFAQTHQMQWVRLLRNMVFIGTPHQGAQLERAGQWVERQLNRSPYSAPFMRITKVRSVGIHDLCHGIPNSLADSLPKGVACYAIAGTHAQDNADQSANTKKSARLLARLKSDGLVTVASALGDHKLSAKNLHIPQENRRLIFDTNHFKLLESVAVTEQLKKWLVH